MRLRRDRRQADLRVPGRVEPGECLQTSVCPMMRATLARTQAADPETTAIGPIGHIGRIGRAWPEPRVPAGLGESLQTTVCPMGRGASNGGEGDFVE